MPHRRRGGYSVALGPIVTHAMNLGEMRPPGSTLRWTPSISSHSRMGGNAISVTVTIPL